MIDSTESGAVVDECAAWPAELVVEGDAGGETEKALKDSLSEPCERSCSVALEGEDVLAGPEDRLDALADRCQVRASAGLVLAAGSYDRGLQLPDVLCELSPGIALVADQRHFTAAVGAGQQPQGNLALIALGRGQRERPRCAVGREDRMQAESPEEAGVAAAVAVVGGVG